MLSRNKLVFAQGLTPYLKHKDSSNCFFVYSSAHYEKDILSEKEKKLLLKIYLQWEGLQELRTKLHL